MPPLKLCPAALVPLLLTAAIPAPAGSPAGPASSGETTGEPGLFSPHLHFSSVYGATSAVHGHEFAAGHHDPVEDGWTLPGIEAGLSARFTEHLAAFGSWHGYLDSASPHEAGSRFEEGFLKFSGLPGGFDLRAGRYLNRFGLHNALHSHAWDWADLYLVNGRFLGGDGLASTGAELHRSLPLPWTSSLTVSAGEALSGDHGHDGEESGAAFDGSLLTARWANLWNVNDFHQFQAGLSGVRGDDARGGGSVRVFGAHFEYQWREKGLERGGDSLRWRTEVLYREAGDPLSGWGLYSSATWGKELSRGILELSLRGEFAGGTEEPDRHRFSPGLTWSSSGLRQVWVRAQGNLDGLSGHDSEQSVWLSCGFNLGGPEVR